MKKSTLRVVNSAATWHNFQSKLKKKKKRKTCFEKISYIFSKNGKIKISDISGNRTF